MILKLGLGELFIKVYKRIILICVLQSLICNQGQINRAVAAQILQCLGVFYNKKVISKVHLLFQSQIFWSPFHIQISCQPVHSATIRIGPLKYTVLQVPRLPNQALSISRIWSFYKLLHNLPVLLLFELHFHMSLHLKHTLCGYAGWLTKAQGFKNCTKSYWPTKQTHSFIIQELLQRCYCCCCYYYFYDYYYYYDYHYHILNFEQ
jgi:hypothetical protein